MVGELDEAEEKMQSSWPQRAAIRRKRLRLLKQRAASLRRRQRPRRSLSGQRGLGAAA